MDIIKKHFTKRNILYLTEAYLFLCFFEILLFVLYYSRFYEVYHYHHMKFNYDFYGMCIDYIRLNSLIVFPMSVPFEMLFLYKKSKSIVFPLIANIGICIFAICLNYAPIYINVLISSAIGYAIILLHNFITKSESLKKLRSISKEFIVFILQNIVVLLLNIFFIIFLLNVFLPTFNYNELGYIGGMHIDEYSYLTIYEVFVPLMTAFLFVKPNKISTFFYLAGVSGLSVYFILQKYTINYIKNNFLASDDIYIFYMFMVTLIVILMKYAANKLKFTITRRI